ncbi:MAG: hypothetical protein JSS02_01155 [Planctomycetes bacterium]|nr:hypothetical protein [Planctomycetota bacterium]
MMSDKDAVLKAVQKLSDDATFEQILEHLEILASIRQGERDFAAGRTLPHDNILTAWHSSRQDPHSLESL